MRLSRLHLIALPLLVVASACRESTGPGTAVSPGAVTWIEWPSAVRSTDTDSVRVTVAVPCGYRAAFGIEVTGMNVHLTVEGRALSNIVCVQSGTGAGYDTVLALPQLGVGIESLHPVYRLWAPVLAPEYSLGSPTVRALGSISVLYAPDTTTEFAGLVSLTVDSLGCWRGQPWSGWPRPRWAFAEPLPLTPESSGRLAFLVGQFVAGSPSACGEARGIEPYTLEVDATP